MKATFLDAFRSEEDLETPDSGSAGDPLLGASGPASSASAGVLRPPSRRSSSSAALRPSPPSPPPVENVIKPPPPFGKPPAAEPPEPPESTVVLTRARLALLDGDRIAKEFPLKPGRLHPRAPRPERHPPADSRRVAQARAGDRRAVRRLRRRPRVGERRRRERPEAWTRCSSWTATCSRWASSGSSSTPDAATGCAGPAS